MPIDSAQFALDPYNPRPHGNPDYQAIMLPLLRFAGDGAEHSLREPIESLADEFKLSDEERRELLVFQGNQGFGLYVTQKPAHEYGSLHLTFR
jgi:Mrr N-terminal domain